MEITFVPGISVHLDIISDTRLKLKSFMDDEHPSRLYKFGKMSETFEIGFLCAINVKMVRIGSSDNRHIR